MGGCGGQDISSSGSGAGGAGGASGGGGSGGAVELAPCSGDISWSTSTPLGSPRDHHGTFVAATDAGAFLHVVGGNDYSQTFDDAWYAPISSSGEVGAWQPSATLPLSRSGFGVVYADGFVALVAGRTKQLTLQDLNEVLVGRIGDDGAIGEWIVGPPLPARRFHIAAVLVGDLIVATGGLGLGGVSAPNVFTARFNDGVVSPWVETTAMPRPRSHHASFVFGDWVYVAGGLDGNPAGMHESLDDVVRAAVQPDGTLGPWEPVSTLTVPLSTHSAELRGRCLHLNAGIESGFMHSAAVHRADMGDDGSVGSWSLLPSPLPGPRSHLHQAPIYGEYMYLVGGSVGLQDVVDTVTVGHFMP